MISVRRLATGYEVKTREDRPRSRTTTLHVGSFHGALNCVRHHLRDHYPGRYDDCPLCLEQKQKGAQP